MSKNGDQQIPVVLEKGQTFNARKRVREEIVGNHTVIHTEHLIREYKLAEAYKSVRNLEYRSDQKIELQTFDQYLEPRKEWFKLFPMFRRRSRPKYPADEAYRNHKKRHLYPNGTILVLVDNTIYDDVADSINQYVLDVGRDGYWANIFTVQGAPPSLIRSHIRKRHPKGVLLVGAIPAPWFEIDNDFHGYADFPCDLYYMDTNGTWHDNSDDNGKFDAHDGNLDPEIWVGRLWTPTANGNDVDLINDYFTRNHQFRLGMLGHARSALAYVDDDWQGFDDCAFDEQFPATVITKYTDPDVTDADLYKAEVNSLRSWVQLCAHSSPHSHSLNVPIENKKEYIHTSYFRDTNPPNAHFYNLFCCGPGRFTANDYLAGWYIFDKADGGINHGLTAVASAKSGSMKIFEDFYRPLGKGNIIGDAFVEWWKARGPYHDHAERCWYYGLVLLGDPTLTWWKGAVPHVEQPEREDIFDHWPRKMQFRWDPVNLPGVKYTVEVDAYGAVNGKWAEETGQSFRIYSNIVGNTLDHEFVGAQRGRWRVRAEIDGQSCSWSPWSYFRFTI